MSNAESGDLLNDSGNKITKPTTEASNAQTERLHNLLKTCPLCAAELDGHDYALCASAVLRKDFMERTNRFEAAFKSRNWRELVGFQDWLGSEDNLLVFALRCLDSRLAVAMVHDAYAPEFGYTLLSVAQLETDESSALITIIPVEAWKPFRGHSVR